MNKRYIKHNLYSYLLFTIILMTALLESVNAQTKQDSSILYTATKMHIFSSEKYEDLFQITLNGKDTLNGVITFQIITKNSKIIYKEKFPSIDLIGYGLVADNVNKITHKDSCDYILERMNKFFIDENFFSPAVDKGEAFDPEESDKKIWNDIASDTTAIGFYYLVGEENNRQIAFSKKTAKVVVYRSYD
ncbi:MAG: hypothetical protein HF300_15220 [Ignavibacteria bacterium]|nr:hypothetical protein [Ignavibacteria bacterium]MCU7522661.1 hypothetical protein [Ignavibacteria bacterium]MCU7526356.1 hypothetical protein [Ignavibacteria bacterium]